MFRHLLRFFEVIVAKIFFEPFLHFKSLIEILNIY